jgi:xanthine dehydrogenase YagS FAD-binding subunit
MKASGGTIQSVRVVVGAVAATPMRLTAVETAVTGKPRNNDTAQMAGEMAIDGAQPLRYNGYKVPLMRNLVARAIRGTSTVSTT